MIAAPIAGAPISTYDMTPFVASPNAQLAGVGTLTAGPNLDPTVTMTGVGTLTASRGGQPTQSAILYQMSPQVDAETTTHL